MQKTTATSEDIHNKISTHRGIINARWFIIFGISALGIFLKLVSEGQFLIGLDSIRIGSIMAIAIASNIGYYLYFRNETKVTELGIIVVSILQVTIDIILYTIIIFFSGGITSTSFIFYVFAVINASALFRARGVFYAVFLSIFLYTALIYSEFYGLIDHIYVYEEEFRPFHYQNYAYTFVIYITSMFVIAISGGFSSIISGLLETSKEQVKSERDRVASIIEDLPNGIIFIDNFHQITFANKEAASLLEVPQSSMIDLKITKQNLLKSKKFEYIYKVFFPTDRYHSPSLKQQYEIVLDGTEQKVLKIETVMVTGANVRMLGFMKVIHDITREKSIDKMKSEFISIAAHQLRTPLSALKWSLRMVLDGDVGKISPEIREFLQKDYNTNDRMIKLVNDLLNVSRIEEGRFFHKFAPVNLAHLVDSIVQDFTPQSKKRNIKLEWTQTKQHLPLINADRDHLRLALQNILDNALKYTPYNGTIKVSLQKAKTGNSLVLKIVDSGIGIPAEEQKRVFSKFFRGANVIKLQTDGTGLGLFIVKNVIELHQGTITFESSEKGTTFIITLPPGGNSEKDGMSTDSFQNFITQF